MGVGLQLLQELSKRLIEKTGTDEALHFLVKERFSENLDAVVDTIAACDWRIPASELRDRAQVVLERDFDFDEEFSAEQLNAWRNLEWRSPLRDLGIPYQSYDDDPAGSGDPAIPPLFRTQLDGRIVSYPIRVHTGRQEYGNFKEYIVIGLEIAGRGYAPQQGEKLNGSDVRGFGLVEARYIDFDR